VRQQHPAANCADLLSDGGREATVFASREIADQSRGIDQRTTEKLLEPMDERVLAEHSFGVGSVERALKALPR
jgi:hypothetical protein